MTSYFYVLNKNSLKQLKKLPSKIQIRILSKLDYYASIDNPLSRASKLSNFDLGEYRFRIGDYRIIFDVENENELVIQDIGHRREIYR